MPTPRAVVGGLRHVIKITQEVTTKDGAGGFKVAWEPLITTRASIRMLRGRESLEYQNLEARVELVIQMRYDPHTRILPEHRVAYTDQYGVEHIYQIHSVNDIDMGHHLIELACEEKHIA